MSAFEKLDAVFSPRSIAIIGASRNTDKEKHQGWTGRLLQFGYTGRIFPINPQADYILGLRAYPSITDVPDEIVDYAIISVAAPQVPKAVSECVEKGVSFIHIFTAGFSETGKERGRQLQAEIASIIQKSNSRLIGPNCMGIYCPKTGLTFDTRFSKESGPIAFVSQTGVGGRQLIYSANQRGLRFSKAVSYGNAVDLDGTDFVDYLMKDPETGLILIYIEGVRDSRSFLRAVSECVKVKPVVILKAGLGESGAEAVKSHTASLSGSREIWKAFFKKTGAIPVETFEEAVDQVVGILHVPPIKGRRAGIVGRGGGPGIIAVDICDREGLSVPELAAETRSQLEKITPTDAGSSVRNPVEVGIGAGGVSKDYAKGLEIVASDPQVDFILTHLNPEGYFHYGDAGDWQKDLKNVLLTSSQTIAKPLIVVIIPGQTSETFGFIKALHHELIDLGLPVFSSIEAAVRVARKTIEYYEFLSSSS